MQALEGALSSWRLRSRFRIPANESALIAEIHRVGHVLELRYEGNDALIVAHVPPDLAQKLERYAEHVVTWPVLPVRDEERRSQSVAGAIWRSPILDAAQTKFSASIIARQIADTRFDAPRDL